MISRWIHSLNCVYKWIRRDKYWHNLEDNSLWVHNLLDEFGIAHEYGPPKGYLVAIKPDSPLFGRVIGLIELLAGEPLPEGRVDRAQWIEERKARNVR